MSIRRTPDAPRFRLAEMLVIGALLVASGLASAPAVDAQTRAVPRTSAPPASKPLPAPVIPAQPAPRPLSGTISNSAGRVAGPSSAPAASSAQPGLRTRPIRTRSPGGAVYIPLGVADAPVYNRGGSTLSIAAVSPPVVSEPAFYPSPAPPVWRIVKEENPAQAWRLVDVDDVICFPSGTCRTVTTRVVARWIPPLRAYGFRDRLGRLWQVE